MLLEYRNIGKTSIDSMFGRRHESFILPKVYKDITQSFFFAEALYDKISAMQTTYLLKPPFLVVPEKYDFSAVWEDFCCKLLSLSQPNDDINHRNPPEDGIDIYNSTQKIAYQCKSVESGKSSDFKPNEAIKSIERALSVKEEVGWEKYAVCTNVLVSGAAEKKMRKIYPDLIIHSESFWTQLCERFSVNVERNFRRLSSREEKPQLVFSTNIDSSHPRDYEKQQGWKSSWFIRLQIKNNSQVPAKRCVGYLLEVQDEYGKQLGTDTERLYWKGQNDQTGGFKPVDIPGGQIPFFLDIAQLKQKEDILTLRVVMEGGQRLVMKNDLPPGTYYACIAVCDENTIYIEPAWFRIKWISDYSLDKPCSINEVELPISCNTMVKS